MLCFFGPARWPYMPPSTCSANLLPRFVRLFRFLPVDRCFQLAREVESCTLPWLCERLDLPLDHPAVRAILQTPTAHGGLSLLRLHLEALLRCISGLLALPVEGAPLTPAETGHCSSSRLTVVNAPASSAHLLPHHRAAHLRRLVYEALAQDLVHRCP